ncbi:MAG: hypothetical protein IJ703_02025 [Eubacterium sp.]|nr:hypothetical protein [Eubacterium sp.]
MPKENSKVKDSVFVDLFQTYEKAAEYDRSLVRWLMNLSDDWNGEIKPLHLDDTFYKSFINDVSFLTDDVLLVLMEHQSIVNPNMPFRALLYVSRLPEMFVDIKARYKKSLAKIPKPILWEYSQLVQTVREKRESKNPDYLKDAINECIKSGILTDYLTSRRSEVCNMLIAEYDYDTDIAVQIFEKAASKN